MGYLAETPRLYLEKLEVDEHLQDFYECWNTDEAVIWSSKPKQTNINETKEWMQLQLPRAGFEDIDKFAILLKPTAIISEGNDAQGETPVQEGERAEEINGWKLKMIGFVGSNRWCVYPNADGSEGKALEMGYCLNIAFWGKGYATEALEAFLTLYWTLPDRKNINRLVGKTSPSNVASQRVLTKAGGVKGEILKDDFSRFVDNGVKTDTWCWIFDRPEDGKKKDES